MTGSLEELLSSEAWKLVSEECWRMWAGGIDRLRKAKEGREAERAKQIMEDAERILKLPRTMKSITEEQRKQYESKLAARETKTVRAVFDDEMNK